MIYNSLEELSSISKEQGKELWEIVLEVSASEDGMSKTEVYEGMRKMLTAMREADASYDKDLVSSSKMAGGDGWKLHLYNEKQKAEGKTNLCGDLISLAAEKAIKMGESNACMRRIVAAPTAGSCGVIPAVLLSYAEVVDSNEEMLIKALLIAGGIGNVIARNASISGAEGGCQAEIGSASAMAAGALTFLCGGDNREVLNAVAMSLKNMLGLTCDPVAGLVEVPCIKRNVSGAINAVATTQMALAGIKSRIPVDEVIDSMRRIGKQIPPCLKETGGEGLAITPTALKISEPK